MVAEERSLTLPPGPVLSEVRIGLYETEGQTRLRLPDGADAVIIKGP